MGCRKTLRGDHAWRLISYPALMNEAVYNEDGSISEAIQLAIPFPQNHNWSKGEVLVLSQTAPQNVANDYCTLLPAFTAIGTDGDIGAGSRDRW